MLNVQMLQTPGVMQNTEPVAFPYKRADALFYYMLVCRSATRQELISLLWEDCDEATGLKNLRNTLYSLKKSLGGDFLLSRQRSVIAVNEEWDVDSDYERLMRQGDPSAYRGEFLQGFVLKRAFAFDEWMREMREKTKEKYLELLVRQAEEAIGQDGRQAISLAQQYVREDPYHEPMHGLLMKAYAAAGEYEKAVQVFGRLKDRLEAELGTAPQESTRALYYGIMEKWNRSVNGDGGAREVDEAREAEPGARIEALWREVSERLVPFPHTDRELPPRIDVPRLEKEAMKCEDLFARIKEQGTDRERADRLEWMLSLAAGELALFAGDLKRGTQRLGSISSIGDRPEKIVDAEVCAALAAMAVYRQEPYIAERYVATGTRLFRHGENPLWTAHFYRLSGCCYCLRKIYDKASYYLQEAIDILEKLPQSAGVRRQLAAAYGDYARVCRHRRGYAEASALFKKALSLLGEERCPGTTWLLVHYGRTVFALEDHPRAAELFRSAHSAALTNGELPGRTAAAAYMAYYYAKDGEYDRAAGMISDAAEHRDLIASPLEAGILDFVSMTIRRKLDLEGRRVETLEAVLPETAGEYARAGIRVLSGIPDVFEADEMSRMLKESLSGRPSFRARELYSKNRHFMTE